MVSNEGMDGRLTLSIAETAERLGISVRHCYQLARKGAIPTVRLGARLVVPVEELKAMLAKPATPEE